jgi:hypothetical protein
MLLPTTIQPRVPDGTPADMVLGFRVCRPDMRSRGGFRWPNPGEWAEAPGPIRRHRGACPEDVGDGLCVARTTSGAASGGINPGTYLLVAYAPDDVLGEDHSKVRVRRALVLDVFTYDAFIGANADLQSADLRSADLRYANLRYANLQSADLRSADLQSADLRSADLRYANLRSADLRYANLQYARGSIYTTLPTGWKVDEASGLIVRTNEVS